LLDPENEAMKMILMKHLAITGLVLFLSATAVGHANSVDDATAGVDALNQGDYGKAVQLFTQALSSGDLSAADRESALVTRAEAYFSERRNDLALTDLEQALKLNPHDQEAMNLQIRVKRDSTTHSEPALRTGAAKPTPEAIGEFISWIAAKYTWAGKLTCYAFTRPGRLVAGTGPVLTVTDHFDQRDEVAITTAFAEGSTLSVQVDETTLDFYVVGHNAFARDGSAAVAAFERGTTAVAHVPGAHGMSTLSFSLDGFSAAHEAMSKACPAR
jgi:tetratricopeptide (TPR) repeat protein